MGANQLNHIDLRVSDMNRTLPFYSVLLPALGFTEDLSGESWKVFKLPGAPPSAPYFAFTEQAGHVPNSTRIAFWANSPGEVDRVAALIRKAGGRNIQGPRACPEYSSTYYAVFFEDPCGNRLEVCFREN